MHNQVRQEGQQGFAGPQRTLARGLKTVASSPGHASLLSQAALMKPSTIPCRGGWAALHDSSAKLTGLALPACRITSRASRGASPPTSTQAGARADTSSSSYRSADASTTNMSCDKLSGPSSCRRKVVKKRVRRSKKDGWGAGYVPPPTPWPPPGGRPQQR